MPNNAQQVIKKAEAELKKSAAALASSQAAAAKLQEDVKQIEKQNQQQQAAIDGEIEKIVEDTDEAALAFIKATEE